MSDKQLEKTPPEYLSMLSGMIGLLEDARRTAARTVNSIMTATYWEVGHRIVEYEQDGKKRAEYGTALLKRLSADLTKRLGRGFSRQNLQQMRQFYLVFPPEKICQKASGNLLADETSEKGQKASGNLPQTTRKAPVKWSLAYIAGLFPLPWSHYVRLLSVKNADARSFYEIEALRGGWSEPQLDRQISSMFYERTALSRNKAAMLKKGEKALPQDTVSPEEEIKNPLVLEFLGLKDEYSESELEDAIIRHLESFLLELGTDFAFIGRQKRLRIDDTWFRVDLVFFHRRLKCLVLIDLKLGRFTHADSGQMQVYLNYARENWTRPDENPPVGIILCAEKGNDLVRYALGGSLNRMLAAEYQTILPDADLLLAEIEKTRKQLELRKKNRSRK